MRDRRLQRGQAIVLVALMMAVLLGFVGLAIDTARAFDGRRVLQGAVDSAALAAADSYQAGAGWAASETAGATELATNLGAYTAPNCGGFATPVAGGAATTTTCTLVGGVTVTVTAQDKGPGGQVFSYTAQQTVTAVLIQVVGQDPRVPVTATGAATASDQAAHAALTTLSGAGCYGASGTSLSITGSSPVSIYGDVISSGAFSIDAASNLAGAGDIGSRCTAPGPTAAVHGCWQASPPSTYAAVAGSSSCTSPAVLGQTRLGYRRGDPLYAPPSDIASLPSRGTPAPNGPVLMSPGIYANDPYLGLAFGNPCYFLAGGTYDFTGGASFYFGMVSNHLRPPSAQDTFWTGGGARCKGSFTPTATSGSANLADGTWSIWLTSTRTDTVNGVSYSRESAPSDCQSVTLANQSMQITVSNVPGATGYNVYGAVADCAQPTGKYGYLGSFTNSYAESNQDVSNCPDSSATPHNCTLGQSSYSLKGNNPCVSVVPGGAIPPGTCGALMPDPLTAPFRSGLPKQNPVRAATARPASAGGGDLANYNRCAAGSSPSPAACPGTATPGAVSLYLPSGGCFYLYSQMAADLFSGSQYNWVVLNQPKTNSCPTNTVQGAAGTGLVGAFYSPAATVAISGANAFQTPDFGGLIANQVTINNAGGLEIALNPNVAPAPPGVRLSG